MPELVSKPFFHLTLFALLITLFGCASQPAPQAKLDKNAPFAATSLPSPVPDSAIEQRLVALPGGKLLVAWWENPPHYRDNLQIAAREGNAWAAA